MADDEGDVLFMWRVYDHPRVFLNRFVERRFQATRDLTVHDGPPATGEYLLAPTREELRKKLKELDSVMMVRLDRGDGDEPLVIGTWGFELVEGAARGKFKGLLA